METQKIISLLNGSDKENSEFATKKWYIIDNESIKFLNPIKCLTKSIESSLCDYSDARILVTGNINVTGGDNSTKVVFKNFAPFKDFTDNFVDYADFINITMPMYNLIEYSDNYSDTSGNLWNFKRDEIIENINVTNNNSSSFKYKANLIGNTDANGVNRKKENVKIAVPLEYLSNFWRSIEMPLIICKVEISSKWTEKCILSSSGTDATFEITDAKPYIPIVTLKTEANTKLSKLLSKWFKRPIYWNEYKVIAEKIYVANKNVRTLIDPSWQVINILFVLAYLRDTSSTINSNRKYFLPRVKIENYIIEIDGRDFFMISQLMTQLNNMTKLEKYQQDKVMIILLVVY